MVMKNTGKNQLFILLVLLLCWTTTGYTQLEVLAPGHMKGEYPATFANFGPIAQGFTGEIAIVKDMKTVLNLAGKVALIDRRTGTNERGIGEFVKMVQFAEDAGAIGAIISDFPPDWSASDPGDELFWMMGYDACQLSIPAIAVSYNTGQLLGLDLAYRGMAVFVSLSPEPGASLENPIDISTGNYFVDGITSGEGLLYHGRSVYYRFTPENDGRLVVSSYLGGTDTYLSIIETNGDCRTDLIRNKVVLAESDDNCDDGNGNMVASSVMLRAEAGKSYYIVWSDKHSADDFSFNLSFDPIITPPETDNTIPLLEATLSMAPNPTEEWVKVDVETSEIRGELRLRVLNVQGQEILRHNLGYTTEATTEFFLGDQPPGMYVICLDNGEACITKHLVKQ
jgi:hypothetical protein